MRILSYLFAIAAFAVVLSCGKATPESETKTWEANKNTLATLGAKYPGFKPALDEVLATATTQWEAALKITEAEKQVEAMRAANTAASPEFVTKLDGMTASLEALKDMATDALQAAGTADEGDKAALRNANNESNLTLNNVETMLKSGSAATAAAAAAIVADAATQVEAATGRLQKVMETIKGKQTATTDTTAAGGNTAPADDKKSIKCGFCGTMNTSDALKCSSCGAPIEKK